MTEDPRLIWLRQNIRNFAKYNDQAEAARRDEENNRRRFQLAADRATDSAPHSRGA